MNYEIEQGTLKPRPTVVMREKVTVADMPAFFGRTYGLVAGAIHRAGGQIAGAPFARYRMIADGEFEVEAGFPVVAPVKVDGQAEASSLPGGPVVATWHVGPYSAMEPAYEALDTWLEQQGATATSPPWEVYYSEPTDDPSTWRTEIVQPCRS